MPTMKFKPFKIGDSGKDVAKIAMMLKKHGSTIKPTNKYHIGMDSAVRKFQKNHNLPVTGVVDKKTWDKLMMPLPVQRKAKKATK